MNSVTSLPDGVLIRDQAPDDANDVRALIGDAFGREVVADLEQTLSESRSGFGLVAENDGQIIGHIRLSRGWLDAPDRLVEVMILSPLSVATTWQRQGVGSALVTTTIAKANALGEPLIFLEGDPAYYSRLGFTSASARGFVRPSPRIPDPGFQVIGLDAYEPSMTGAVVYADAFWQYDLVGLRGDSH